MNPRGAYVTFYSPDGHVLDVLPLTFGRARLCIARDALVETYLDGF